MTRNTYEKWRTTESRYLVRETYIKLRADTCLTPDGGIFEPYYVLEFGDWANCVVIDANGDVVLVRHYRHAVGDYVLELVSGCLETSDASAEDGIRRELEEEAGYVGGEIHPIGVSYANPATHTNKVHSFLAIGGSCVKPQRLEPGELLFVEKIPFADFVRLVSDPAATAIYQSMHLAAFFLAFNFIRRSSLESLRSLKALL